MSDCRTDESPENPTASTRRIFLQGAAGCAAHILTAAAVSPAFTRGVFAARQMGEVVYTEPFGRLEQIADGVWALVSTPLEARQTLSNGGIVAGTDGVLTIEGLNTPEGARWLIDAAVELTGRRPEHVVLTHYHGDHSRGLPGYVDEAATPVVYSTQQTLELLEQRRQQAAAGGNAAAQQPDPTALLTPEHMVPSGGEPLEIDLGGRLVRVRHRLGHTPSDLTVELDDPRVVFCGDLVWNGMFPNYMDAIPSFLWQHCDEMLRDPEAVYVPGHGAVADADGIAPYLDLLADVGRAAQLAFDEGLELETAADSYAVPRRLGEWFMFSPSYYEVAFRAWYQELGGQQANYREPARLPRSSP